VTAAVGTVFLYWGNAFERLENQVVDARFRLRGPLAADPSIAIVAVDEASVAGPLGRFPWPREVHARLVDRLTKAGAAAVAFDILFSEVDRDHPDGDVALGESARRSGRVALVGAYKGREGPGRYIKFQGPIDVIRRGVRVGFVNVAPERDGILRRVPLWNDDERESQAGSLSLHALAVARGRTLEEMIGTYAGAASDESHEMTLNFLGDEPFPFLSYQDVLAGKVPAGRIKDKIVLVGGTALGAFDHYPFPNRNYAPGVEAHATALDNLLKGRWLRASDVLLVTALTGFFALAWGMAVSALPVSLGVFLYVALVGAYFGAGQWLFSHRHFHLDFVAPAMGLTLSHATVILVQFARQEKEKRRIRGSFGQYLSSKVIDILIREPERLRLGGEEKEMTVFFSDIAGFTTFAEPMSPTTLVALLNDYLTAMSGVILKHDGVVDKYIGDAIMAFWNAPVDHPGHALAACRAALEQEALLAGLRKRFLEQGRPAVDFRIGINTGRMVVGNMGSETRFDYTVMGDAVNLASRLEGANKAYRTRILISEFTRAGLGDAIETRELDLLRVKGRAEPVRVYELMAPRGELPESRALCRKKFEEGLALYRERQFDRALESFNHALAADSQDGPSAVYGERCRLFAAAPPPPAWNGVTDLKTK
jgi:adenylate cyclase